MRIPTPLAALGLVASALVSGCEDFESPTVASMPLAPQAAKGGTTTPSGRVAFVSDRDDPGNLEVYSMDADGKNLTRLTFNQESDFSPAVSRDGKRILFTHTAFGGDLEVWVMNADGSGVTRLTDTPGHNHSASWSRDGKRIAFVSTRDAIDPDNAKPNETEIYVMNADGSGQTRLTDNSVSDSDPTWAPDGRRIAFVTERDSMLLGPDKVALSKVYTMNADGTAPARVLPIGASHEDSPAWSPDGGAIAFESNVAGGQDVFVVALSTGIVTRLTDHDAVDGNPTWSPDGKHIAFSSLREDPNSELYVMRADGSQVTRVTFSVGVDGGASWAR